MQIGVSCIRGCVPWKECLDECAPNPLHPCMLHRDLLITLQQKPGDRHGNHDVFSPTGLMDCHRKSALKREHDYYVDVDDSYAALRGTLIHQACELLENEPGVKVLRELEMAVDVMTKYGTQVMAGKADIVVIRNLERDEGGWVVDVEIGDYKSTGEIKHDLVAPKQDHVRQLNMYAAMLRLWLPEHLMKIGYINEMVSVNISNLWLQYLGMNKPRRFTSAGPLQTRGKMLTRSPKTYETLDLAPIPIYSDATVWKKIREWIEQKIEARTTLPPVLQGDDAWRCGFCELRTVCYDLAERGM